MVNGRCPYCTRSLADPGVEDTEEHVFVETLGGRSTIRACRDCNSHIGHDIEGRLQQSQALLAVENALLSGHGPELVVEAPNGHKFKANLATGDYRAMRVVVDERRDRDVLRRTLSGPPEQVRAILEGMAAKYPTLDVDAAIAAGRDATAQRLTAAIEVDRTLEARLAAKIALATGTRCLGDGFIRSALAERLRAIVFGDEQPLTEPFEKLEPALQAARIQAERDERQCVLVGLPQDAVGPARTVAAVRMFGRAVPAGDVLVVRAPCPQPMVLLHEPTQGPVECLDAYIARQMQLGPQDQPPD